MRGRRQQGSGGKEMYSKGNVNGSFNGHCGENEEDYAAGIARI